ncbi:MAG: hypothetical protein IIA70_05535, partial [Proteobacteria bacterium]|nr:hypothetical protein [Pseudomonadota bacterium]
SMTPRRRAARPRADGNRPARPRQRTPHAAAAISAITRINAARKRK